GAVPFERAATADDDAAGGPAGVDDFQSAVLDRGRQCDAGSLHLLASAGQNGRAAREARGADLLQAARQRGLESRPGGVYNLCSEMECGADCDTRRENILRRVVGGCDCRAAGIDALKTAT